MVVSDRRAIVACTSSDMVLVVVSARMLIINLLFYMGYFLLFIIEWE